LAVGAVALLLTGSSAFAEVQLSIQNGRVSLVAKDATVRQILTEWARVGQTKILNVERIPGGPLTLELTNVPEQEALDVLLRSISGYMAAPREMAVANLSRFDRIVVMPTTAPPRSAAASAPAPTFAQPQLQPPQFQAPPAPDEDADDERPVPNAAAPNPRGPIFNTFPQPQVVNPQMNPNGVPPGVGNQMQPGQVPQQVAPSAYPTAPSGGVAIPGMVAPAPLQPGQVPGQPGQPVRRPGGPEGSESQ
jgi:hypothetical protein